jgi:multicomponent Na+:H+ antiporter subunit D
VAAVTIVWGSFRALSQDELKKRLAYSTVSQVAYIVLGTAIVGQISTVGGLVHLVHQGIMKITLFFCAGNLAETLGVHAVSELRGAGRRMPLTMAAFTVAALGMIGLPPMAGFTSKWYLGVGGLEAGEGWVVLVLATSTLLNAAYFLPILRKAWFEPPPAAWPHEVRFRHETSLGLLVPPLVTAALVLLAGLFAGTGASPVSWAKLVVAREYAASAVVPALPLARTEGLGPSWAGLGLIVPAALAFAAAILAAARPAGRAWRGAAVAGAAAAAAAAVAGPAGPLELPGLLLGVRPGLDVAGRAALLLSGAALVFALRRRAMPGGDPAAAWTALLAAGVASSAVAFDAGALTLGFVALVFGGYGLAERRGADGAAAAGRFMAFAVLGEVLLVDALAELGLSARSSGIEAMRAAIDAEVGAGAAGLLLAAAYGLPLALAGLRGPVLPTLAFVGAGAMAILRIVPRQGGAVEAATPLLMMLGFGTAAALLARFLPRRRARADASAAGHGHGHGDEPAVTATDLAAGLPAWLGSAEQGLGRLAGSGLLALLLVAALALLLR